MFKSLTPQRLVALFAVGSMLLNAPLLALWDQDARVLGLPLFPAMLFLLWGVLIACVAWLLEGRDDG
jgi:hypothetical protein